jgi:hypothetical protein
MKLLLHVCCAPCLSGAHLALAGEGFDLTGYFYNPNIHPKDELARRIDNLRKYDVITDSRSIIVDDYDPGILSEYAENNAEKCRACFSERLGSTAEYAKRNGFDAFSTTLLISPYQKHELIRTVGEEVSDVHGVDFFYRDMRPFYRESVNISKAMGLYRQRYCGCNFSKESKNGQAVVASK